MTRLKTDWVVIATSGKTIDGREIEPQWLTDAAECYNRDEYTALLWPYHDLSNWRGLYGTNFGEVDEIKTEKKGGKVQLMARLIPNQFLIEANKAGQKLFTSVEIYDDYLGTGKFFLKGVAVTDVPASISTTRLQFSQNDPGSHQGSVEELTLTLQDSDHEQEQQAKQGFFSRMFSQEKPKPNEQPKATPMDEKQFTQLMDTINQIGTRVETMEKSFADRATDTTAAPTAQTKPVEQPKIQASAEENGASAVTQEQIGQLMTAVSGLSKKMDGISKEFSDLKGESTVTPSDNPSGEETLNLV